MYGYTYRQGPTVWIREDLIEDQKEKTDIHECIHTPDERETRYLVEWILEAMRVPKELYAPPQHLNM